MKPIEHFDENDIAQIAGDAARLTVATVEQLRKQRIHVTADNFALIAEAISDALLAKIFGRDLNLKPH